MITGILLKESQILRIKSKKRIDREVLNKDLLNMKINNKKELEKM